VIIFNQPQRRREHRGSWEERVSSDRLINSCKEFKGRIHDSALLKQIEESGEILNSDS
jgi:hypothetical protein